MSDARGDTSDLYARGRAASSIPASLAFEHVGCKFPGRVALADVSFALAPGAVLGLLGPSGCGKTTLLRIAAGIERPTSGRVRLDNREVAGPSVFVPPERRNIGLVFQDFALFPHLTLVANVAFGLNGLPKVEARRIAMANLERVGLAALAESYPHVLSGGEQQRVALARAIAPRPGVLLLDEPFSGLDVELRAAMQDEMRALLRETGATSIIVTHQPDEAMRFADRIAVMRAGRIVQSGSAGDLYHRPADIFVNRMFSDANELSAVVGGDGSIATVFGRFAAPGHASGTAVIVAIRYNAVEVMPSGTGPRARLTDVAFMGDETIATYAVEGLDSPIRARTRNAASLRKGEEVVIRVNPDEVLVLAIR